MGPKNLKEVIETRTFLIHWFEVEGLQIKCNYYKGLVSDPSKFPPLQAFCDIFKIFIEFKNNSCSKVRSLVI